MAARSLAAMLFLAAAAACATVTDRHQPGHSLVGTWAYVDRQAHPRPADDCETDFGVTYAANGTFSGYEEAGTWRIEAGDLIESVTEEWDMGGGPEVRRVANPSPTRVRLQWISPDVVNLLGNDPADGYGMVRCRPHRGE